MASQDYTIELLLKANNQLSKELEKVQWHIVKIEKQVNQASNSIDSSIWNLWKALAWVWLVAWFKKVASSVMELAWNLEQAEVAFTTMLWSADKANKMLNDLSDFAMNTPFELTWIRESAKQLLAMWISAEDMIPTLKSLWDVSSWLSVDLSRVALNYWQIATQGKLTWMELRDFTRMWVPLIAELAKNLNVAEKDINDMVSAWKIWFEDVKRAFQTMTSEWWKFADLMDKQSWTLQWSISNLQDSFDHLKETIWTVFVPILTKLVQWITPVIEKIGAWTTEHPKLTAAIWAAITAVVWLTWAITVLTPLIKSVWVAMAALWPIWLAVVAAVWAIAAIAVTCAGNEASLEQQTNKLNKEYEKLNEQVEVSYWNLDDLKSQVETLKSQQEEWIITQDQYNEAMWNSAWSIATETYALVQNTKAVIANRIEKMKLLQSQIEEEQKRDQATIEAWWTIMWAWQIAPLQWMYMSEQLTVGAEIFSLEKQIKDAEADLEKYWDIAVNAYKRLWWAVSNTNDDVTNLNNNISWKSWSKNTDVLKEIKNVYDSICDSVDEQYKKILSVNKEREDWFKDLQKNLDDVDKTIESLKSNISDLKKSLSDLWKDETSDIATEFVNARKELQKMERDYAGIWDVASQYSLDYLENYTHWWIGKYDIDALIQYKKYSDEMASVYDWLNDSERKAMDEQIAYQEWYQSLNGIEKIKEDYRIKREEIQWELNEKMAALRTEELKRAEIEKQMAQYRKERLATLEQEIKKRQAMYLEKLDYEKKYMAQLEIDQARQVEMYNELIRKARELAKARSDAWWPDWTRANGWPVYSWQQYLVWEHWPELFIPSQNWSITRNEDLWKWQEFTINVNMWWVVVNDWQDTEQLAETIANTITRQLELYKKGIY